MELAKLKSHEEYEAVVAFWRQERDYVMGEMEKLAGVLSEIRDYAADHHSDQPHIALLHSLTIDITSMCDDALKRLSLGAMRPVTDRRADAAASAGGDASDSGVGDTE